jgi:uncharacterized protein (DUF1684 family)
LLSVIAADERYRAGVDAWRQEREAGLRADDGWLTVAGLVWLKEGDNRFGGDPGNDVVVPRAAHGFAGVFLLRNGRVTVRAAPGATLLLNGKPFGPNDAPVVLRATSSRIPIDAVTVALGQAQGAPSLSRGGGVMLWVHESGDRRAIRLRDPNSAIRRDFKGLRWFPIDERYRVPATFTPRPPRRVRVPTLVGDFADYDQIGFVRFTLDGQALGLTAFRTESEPPRLYFLFKDLTSGKETYPAIRFLIADMPKDGRTTLDFNKAYNPPCAYNRFTTCPVPPRENHLPVAIRAGEMNYPE